MDEEKLTTEKIKKIFDDEKTRIKLIEIINLKQEERFLTYEKTLLKKKIDKLDAEIRLKHEIRLIDMMYLEAVLMNAEYKQFLKEYGEELNEKRKKVKK